MGRRAQSASGKQGCRCVERGIAQRGCFAACQLPRVKIQFVPCTSWRTALRLELPLQGFLDRFGNIANASSGGGQV